MSAAAPWVPDVRACFVGDSFVAGVGDASGLGWVGRVAIAARAAGIDLTPYNLGVRRETTTHIAHRIAAEVRPRLAGVAQRRVIVSSGVNDTVLEHGRPRSAPEESVAALQRIAAAVDAPLLVVGPPAVDDDAQNSRIALLDTALHGTADALGVPYLSTFSRTRAHPVWRDEVARGDGSHPGAGGYALLAEILGEPVIAWLQRGS